jgi:tetratricopeptide (TPR) repeat protein
VIRFLRAWLVYTWGGLHRYFGNKNNMRAEHEAAVRYFSRAFEIDPTFRRARMERGVLLWRELGRLDEALADFDALLSHDPGYGSALLNRAMVYQNQNRFRAALTDLEAYLRLPPSDIAAYQQEARRTADLLHQMVSAKGE